MQKLLNSHPKDIQKVVLSDCQITLEEFVAVVRFDAKVELDDRYIARVNASRSSLEQLIADGTAIYGVNTGFGENVRFAISEKDIEKLQVNILRTHATSVGEPLSREKVRAMQLMILLSTGMGFSAIRIEPLLLLRDFLNYGIVPYVPGEGSVGGLTIEPHIALPLIGEGRVWDGDAVVPACKLLDRYGLKPVILKCKEGLSLISNTTQVTAVAALALYDYLICIKTADLSGALVFEALQGNDKSLLKEVHQLKNHEEQQDTAEILRMILKNSPILDRSRELRVQDSCALRLIPHIHGSSKRIAHVAFQTILEEIHAVSDNPIVYPNKTVFMGAGFDANYVGAQCDCMAIGAMMIAKLAETHMERLIDHKLSGLPPFLVKNPGLNSGFMLVQYVTAGLQSDISMLSLPGQSDTVSTSAGQENPASMAYTSATKAYKIMDKLQSLLALTILTSLQAIDLIDCGQAPVTKKIHDYVRKSITFMENDELLYPKIDRIIDMVKNEELITLLEESLPDYGF